MQAASSQLGAWAELEARVWLVPSLEICWARISKQEFERWPWVVFPFRGTSYLNSWFAFWISLTYFPRFLALPLLHPRATPRFAVAVRLQLPPSSKPSLLSSSSQVRWAEALQARTFLVFLASSASAQSCSRTASLAASSEPALRFWQVPRRGDLSESPSLRTWG